MAHVDPRVGRSFNLVIAVLAWAVYNSCTSIVQTLIAEGTLGVTLGILVIHGTVAVMVVLLFYRRLSIFRLFEGWRKPR
jgi:lipopolysaccharide export system permease protein